MRRAAAPVGNCVVRRGRRALHRCMDLLRLLNRRQAPAAAFPDGRVGFAVGDIHGRADLLEEMFGLLEK